MGNSCDKCNCILNISNSSQVLMLEKSRLVQRPEGEPSFHILYHFLAGIDATLRLL